LQDKRHTIKVVISLGKISRRVIRFFNSVIHYSKNELGSERAVKKEQHNKPVWITRDGVDVAVVISPELFETLVRAQEELEDIAAVDESQKDKRPGIPWEQVKRNLGLSN
jgi:PHD/YefM family antitoxin component YafN of YafNO toxin-antitoxin module